MRSWGWRHLQYLIIDDKRRTPLKIGHAIAITGVQLQEAQPLAIGLAQKSSNSSS
nr:hypothetical protein [Allocoleopsis franciscana]